jgi:hypothetical protein
VPVVAGKLQRPGAEAKAKVVKAEFTPDADTLVLDITSAYEVPALEKLERTFVYSRAGKGSLTVTDRARFSSPQSFATALVTLGKWSRAADGSLVIEDGKEAVAVTIDAAGAKYAIAAEEIREDAPVTPTRIGVNLDATVSEAVVTVRIAPR